MMTNFKFLLFIFAIGLFLVGCDFELPNDPSYGSIPGQFSINQLMNDNDPSAKLQVIHNAADPAAGTVDIYVNDIKWLENFSFRNATGFEEVPAGDTLMIGVAPAGSESVDDVIESFEVVFEENEIYIAIANGVLAPGGFAPNPNGLDIAFTLFTKTEAREESTDSEQVQFIIVHGSTDAPAVDVVARNVATLVEDATYGAITDYIGVPAAEYIIDILPAGGDTPVGSFVADLSGLAGGAAAVLASGFLLPDDNQGGEAFGLIAVLADGTVIELPVYEEIIDATARLQVIHNAADPAAASVDVYVNGTLLLEGFNFRTATPFIDVPAEVELVIEVKAAGGTDAVGTFPVTLSDGGTYIAIANGVLGNSFAPNPDGRETGFTLFIQDAAQEEAIDSDLVEFFAFHGVTDAPAVDVIACNVATLVENAAYGDMTGYIGVPAARYILKVNAAGTDLTVASYVADVSGLAGGAAAVLASGFLNPEANQDGKAFALIVVLPDGSVIELPTTPDVKWLPPMTNSNFSLKIPSTLPIKFKLTSNGMVIDEEQDVYLMVHGPSNDGIGPGIVRWDLGEGRDALRYSYDEKHYIANFHTREFELESGEMYTAVVHDGETGCILGTYEFLITDAPGANRGNRRF